VGDCCNDACDECKWELKDFCEPNSGPWVNVSQAIPKTPYGRSVAVAHSELSSDIHLGTNTSTPVKHDLATIMKELQASISKGADIITIPVHTAPDGSVQIGLDTETMFYTLDGKTSIVNTGNLVENASLSDILSHPLVKNTHVMVALRLSDQADTVEQKNPDSPENPTTEAVYSGKWGSNVLNEATSHGYGTKQRPLMIVGDTQGKVMLDAVHAVLKTDKFKDGAEHIWTTIEHTPSKEEKTSKAIKESLNKIKAEGFRFVVLDQSTHRLFSYLMYARQIKLFTGVSWQDDPTVLGALREDVDAFFSTYSPDRARRRIHENNAIAYFNVYDSPTTEPLKVQLADKNNNELMTLEGTVSIDNGGDGKVSYPQIVTPAGDEVMGNWLKFDADHMLPLFTPAPAAGEGYLVSAVVWFPQFKDNPNQMDGHYTIVSQNPVFETALYKSDEEMHDVQFGVTLNEETATVNLHDFDGAQYTPFIGTCSYNGSNSLAATYNWVDLALENPNKTGLLQSTSHFTVGARLVTLDDGNTVTVNATNMMKGYIQRLTILYWNPK